MDFLISDDPNRIASALSVNARDAGVSIEEAQKVPPSPVIPTRYENDSKHSSISASPLSMFSLRAPFDEAGTQALPDIRQRALRYHTTMDDVRRMAHEVLPPLRQEICITVTKVPINLFPLDGGRLRWG